MTQRYLSFFTDFGFKRLFGSEPTKACLIDFLNALLDGQERPIKDLTFRRTEHLGASELDRRAIFDLYCENDQGEKFIVELQKTKQKFFKDRSIYYSTFPIQEQAQKGEWDFRLKAIYTVAILDFVFDEDLAEPDKYLYNVKLTDQETAKVFYDKLTFIYLEMPKFTKSLAQLETHLDKWLFAIRNLSRLDTAPSALAEEVFRRFFEAAEIAQLEPQERDDYEQSLKYYRDLNNVVATAREEGAQETAKLLNLQIAEAKAREVEAKAREKEAEAREKLAQAREQEERELKEEERRLKEAERKLKEDALAELARLKKQIEEGK